MSKTALETVVAGVRTILIGNGTSKLLLILFELAIAKALGAAAFGIYAIALAVSQIISNICLLGLNYGVIQHLAIYQEKGENGKIKSAIFFSLLAVAVFSGAVALSLGASADFIAEQMFNKPELSVALKIAAPLLFFDALNQCAAAIFRGLRQFPRNLLTFDLLKNALCFIALPVLLLTGMDIKKILLVCLLGAGAGLFFGLSVLAKERLFPSRQERDATVLRDLMNFSKLLFLWNLLQVLAVRLFIIAAGVFLTAAETGVLAVATRLALVFIFFQTAVNSTVQAEFARFFHLKDTEAQKDLYQSVTQGLLGVVMVPALLILANPVYAAGIFGTEYTTHAWIIWPLLFAHLVNVVTGPAGQVLVASGKQKLLMGLTLYDIGMLMALVVPMMYFYGIAGAAMGEALRILLFVALRLLFLWRDTGVHFFGRCYVPLLALSGAALCSALVLTFAGETYLSATGYALLFYIGGGIWVFLKDERLKEELKMIFKMPLVKASRSS